MRSHVSWVKSYTGTEKLGRTLVRTDGPRNIALSLTHCCTPHTASCPAQAVSASPHRQFALSLLRVPEARRLPATARYAPKPYA